MRFFSTLLLAFLPILCFSQLDDEWHDPDFQRAIQGEDVPFDYDLINTIDDSIMVTWEFTHHTNESAGQWVDYFCEVLIVCHPATTRSNTFPLPPQSTMPCNHHIQTYDGGDTGTFVSTAIIYVEGDSAITRREMVVTLQTGLEISVDGQTAYFFGNDTFELYGNQYVPLGVESIQAKSKFGNVYPNPSNGDFTIPVELEDDGILVVTDVTGKTVATRQLGPGSSLIDINEVSATGFFNCSLYSHGKLLDTKRLLIVK